MDTLNDMMTDLLIDQDDLMTKHVGPDSFWALSDKKEQGLIKSLEVNVHANQN